MLVFQEGGGGIQVMIAPPPPWARQQSVDKLKGLGTRVIYQGMAYLFQVLSI